MLLVNRKKEEKTGTRKEGGDARVGRDFGVVAVTGGEGVGDRESEGFGVSWRERGGGGGEFGGKEGEKERNGKKRKEMKEKK